MVKIVLSFLLVLFTSNFSFAHEIYSGVHGKNGQLCCGAEDCGKTVFRIVQGRYEFLTREHTWVEIPQDRITFLPIPGDDYIPVDGDSQHYGHLCYRTASNYDRQGQNHENVFGDIYLYCAFIPPGGV